MPYEARTSLKTVWLFLKLEAVLEYSRPWCVLDTLCGLERMENAFPDTLAAGVLGMNQVPKVGTLLQDFGGRSEAEVL